nr:AMP-binding protein [Deltaproteobacteria bacterium]
MPASSIAEMFVSALHDYPDRVFLRWHVDGERIVWTYAEAAVRIDALARRLEALGAGFGDNVVVHTHAMVPSILFDLACACTGIVFTPIETTSLPAVIDVVKRTDARAVMTTPDRTGPYDGRPIVHEDGRGPA